jgi:pyoverdine/dityrosine biosynthesis protein Dit1
LKKITKVRKDKSGNIAKVKLDGNTTFTSLKRAVEMAEKGLLDAVPVKTKDNKKHLRSKPDQVKRNNLSRLT